MKKPSKQRLRMECLEHAMSHSYTGGNPGQAGSYKSPQQIIKVAEEFYQFVKARKKQSGCALGWEEAMKCSEPAQVCDPNFDKAVHQKLGDEKYRAEAHQAELQKSYEDFVMKFFGLK